MLLIALIWLVFYPPATFRRWINRNAILQPRAA
jgi:hypothetical protein